MDGHLNPDPVDSKYAGVVSRESVRIALTYAVLLGIGKWAADIMNEFVQALTPEKYYRVCGPISLEVIIWGGRSYVKV